MQRMFQVQPEMFFEGSYIDYCTLYVPQSSVDAYKATAPWSGFGTFKTTEGVAVQEPEPCAAPEIEFVNGKVVCTSETEGAACVFTGKPAVVFDEDGNTVFTLIVTAYAKAEGWLDSKVVTKTFTILPGDITGDGKLSVADLTAISNKILGKEK